MEGLEFIHPVTAQPCSFSEYIDGIWKESLRFL
jgi:hypothetical protein